VVLTSSLTLLDKLEGFSDIQNKPFFDLTAGHLRVKIAERLITLRFSVT
jgi:hypothetical protein